MTQLACVHVAPRGAGRTEAPHFGRRRAGLLWLTATSRRPLPINYFLFLQHSSISPSMMTTTMMLCQSLRTKLSLFKFNPSRAFLPHQNPLISASFGTAKMSAQIVDHFVFFKVKDETEPSKINSMVSGLNGLASLNQILYLTAGPIHTNRSSAFAFTHLLHVRFKSKQDLSDYAAHPEHLKVVKQNGPIVDDIFAFDWVADLDGPVAPPAGAAMRVTFLKLKEGLGDAEKGQVLGVIGSIKDNFPSIHQISFGENFSPARAKGFSIGSVAVFPGLKELEALDSNEEMMKAQKEKVKDLVESVIVVDYVIPPSQTANP